LPHPLIKKETKMNKLLEFRPPRIAMALLAITAGLWYFSPPLTMLYMPYKLIGTFSIVFGFKVMTWSWLQFKKTKTAVCPTAKSTLVIKNGVYRYSRNPMYLGMLTILLGASFFMGTMQSMLAPMAFFLIIDKVFIPYEEDKLLAQFGEGYAEYTGRVRRWI
jgi:protein-S-isoprenylcysteine O-methyltransferase Ste14